MCVRVCVFVYVCGIMSSMHITVCEYKLLHYTQVYVRLSMCVCVCVCVCENARVVMSFTHITTC